MRVMGTLMGALSLEHEEWGWGTGWDSLDQADGGEGRIWPSIGNAGSLTVNRR